MIPGHPTAIKLASDQTVGGDLCSVLVADIGTGAQSERFEFWFAKRDRFLRKLTIARAPEFAKPLVTETYSGVNAHPRVSAATFIYVPAAGAVATEPPKPGQMYDPRLTPGAMPLPITGKDMLGKAVSLDQFRGKVLLLDFWATWCGPCVAELPNVVAAYGKYHGKGFEVVGISLDQPDSRDKLIKFTQDNKMPWQQIYDGKYWEASNATAYGVSGIPFTVLVGRDGKIAAVDARGNALAPAIEAALKK
jgi:thiol-disulfide isomerase/thioredoxin